MLALIVSGVGLNVTGLVGFLTLFGVSLNHGIVLLTYAWRLERGGKLLEEAVREAVRTRLRPTVLMTFTALLGMLPIALGWGAGAAPEQGRAIGDDGWRRVQRTAFNQPVSSSVRTPLPT